MSESVVRIGEKLHVMARRLFEEDIRRHFAGEVTAVSGALVELRGFTFILDGGTNEFRRLSGERRRIFTVGDAGYVVNKIPSGVNLEALSYRVVDRQTVITDGASFSLPINEFGAAR